MSSRPRSPGRSGRAARATGHAAQGVALLVSFVLMAGIGGVLAAGLVLPAVALANGATNLTTATFNELPTDLNYTELPQKSEIYAADGTTLLATFYDQNRVIVPLSAIAPIMQKAVISVEDKRFYEHSGIDPQGMLRAFARTGFGGTTQGASTLTQQYIKNVQIQAAQQITDPVQRQAAMKAATVDSGTDGYARKLREAKLAISLEKTMSKDKILENYLNIAQFGASSIYGVQAAAQRYFGVDASQLNYLQAATIAGITQSPTKWDPILNPDNSEGRRDTVLKTMHDQGFITDAEYQQGLATPLSSTLKPQPVSQGCMVADKTVPGAGFFCDYVVKVILNDPAFGPDQASRAQLLYKGGLTITTTLVPDEQALAVQAVNDKVPAADPSGIGAAMVTVEPGTGKITAMAQNREYYPVANPGPTQTSVNWNTSFNYGASTGFAAGSTFKPFTLVEWLKSGHSLTQTFDGTVHPLNEHDFTACGKPYNPRSKVWTPGNSEGSGGVMNALDATRNSVNSAYLAMGEQVDLCNVMQDAADLGVVQPGGKTMGERIGAKPANIIGSASVTPLAMAGAFAAFADNGVFCQPIAITRVVDKDGKDMAVPAANCQQKLEPRIASAVNYALRNVWNGTAKKLGQPAYPAAGKTGTTTAAEDIWFVGYTPLRAAAVWVGHPDSMTTMNGLTINGKLYNRRTGGPYGADIPGPIWRQFMDQFMAGKPVADFAPPGNNEVYGVMTNVPDVVGLSQGDATAALQDAGFTVKISGTQATDYHAAGTVVSQSISGRAPKNSTVILTLSNGQGAPPAPPPTTDNPQGNGNPNQGPGPGTGGPGPGGNGH